MKNGVLWDVKPCGSCHSLRSHYCRVFVQNVEAPTENGDGMKRDSYEELESLFNKFLKYHMKTLWKISVPK
jgi:hypothetical protein